MTGKLDRLVRYMVRQWPGLLLIAALTACTSLTVALQPWPLKLLVDYALGGQEPPDAVTRLLGQLGLAPTPEVLVVAAALASLCLFGLTSLVDGALSLSWTWTGQRMVYDLAGDLFQRLLRLSLLFHGNRSVGDSLTRLTGDSWCVYKVAIDVLATPGQELMTLAMVGSLAWALDPLVALLSLAVAPAMVASTIYFGRPLKSRARRSREAQAGLLSFVQQTLTAIPLVQAFGTERRNERRFRSLAAALIHEGQRVMLVRSVSGLANGLISTAGVAAVLYVGSQRVLDGALTVGGLLVILAYLRSMQGAISNLLTAYGSWKEQEASIDRVLEVMEAQEEVHDAPGAERLAGPVAGHVRLRGVTFGYEPGRPVLREVSLEARPGETVALVGPTGAGKSTLVSLLPRFFDPWAGTVELDGRDLRGIRLADLRAHVALVLQEPFLLPLTVAENIAYGRPGAARAEVEAAARAANAEEFIRRLPEGYDTVLGERGATLSGGQRQRLAIARALLKDAPVLILDEPTSALDAGTEALLLEALDRLMAGRTTFIIAHRLSTIRAADRVLVLEDGRLVEDGPPAELLARDGPFRRLHDLQVGGPTRADAEGRDAIQR